MTLSEFINKWLGKKIDFDGFYGGQCVDLYRQYVKEVLSFPQSPGVGGATEIWYSASPEYYDFIKNTSSGVPLHGDIVVWNRNVAGGFGHVDVFVDGDARRFTGFDQNWPTLDLCTLTEHNYTNVIGWLHPKGGTVADMYKGYDLDNKDSMRVAVDVLVRVQNGEFVEKKVLEEAKNRSYERGVADGRQQGGGTIDLSKWKLVGEFRPK